MATKDRKVVQLPTWMWTVVTGSTGTLSICVIAFLSWLAVTTIEQGQILSRIDAEVKSLKQHIESTLGSCDSSAEQTGGQ